MRIGLVVLHLLVGGLAACPAMGQDADDGADGLSSAERKEIFKKYFVKMTTPRSLFRFSDSGSWTKYSRELRREVLERVGLWPLPEKVPLDPRIVGWVERQDVVIERVYYQTLPKICASGYLYRPREAPDGRGAIPAKRRPAVLNPHGHWPEGAADTNVQARCIGLARMGYVAFCPESTHVIDIPIGLCPIGPMTWYNMRGLDFLQSLDDVDPEKLGCTGGSGGGQHTMYLAALDNRVKVIVPAVLVSWFRRILFVGEQSHCFCNHAPGIARVRMRRSWQRCLRRGRRCSSAQPVIGRVILQGKSIPRSNTSMR